MQQNAVAILWSICAGRDRKPATNEYEITVSLLATAIAMDPSVR
jgi:hypothetical protein